jgi:signal transduction histidine kinase/PAS domain-containing protein
MNLPVLSALFGAALTVAPFVILYLIPAVIAAELALYGWQWRHIDAAIPFCLLMTAVAFWSACHAVSVASSGLAATLFWAQVQYGGIVLIAPIWLWFALAYEGTSTEIVAIYRRWMPLPATLSYAAVLTNDVHHLWWPTIMLDATQPFGSLSITRGLLFWLHFGYSYGCIALGFGLIVRKMLVAPPLQRRQAQIVAIGALFPILGNIAHILGLRTSVVDDPTPFLFAASGLVIFYAALRYQFPDLSPVAPHTLFASLPDGLVVLDQRGTVTAVNDAVPRLLELAAEGRKWIGRAFRRIIAGSPLEMDLLALFIPPAAAASHMIAYNHDQGLRAVELRLRPLYEADVRAGSVLVVRDRTKRAQNELAIARQLDQLTVINRLARALNSTHVIADLMQTLAGELRQVIPGGHVMIGLLEPDSVALYRLAGQPPQRVQSVDTDRVAGNDLELVHSALHAGQAQVVGIAEPLLHGTAARVLLEQVGVRTVLIVPLASQADRLGVLLFGHAHERAIVPAQVQLFEAIGELVTEALIRSQPAERDHALDQSTSLVLASITHELRTPLTSIIGFTDMLGRGIFGDLPEHVREPLAHMQRNSHTLLRLVNDILNFSKIEAGRLTLELAPVDLPSVIRDVAGAMQPQVQERGLKLNVDLADDMPPAYANRERLEQVLTNLLANAIKFTNQGSITVRARYDGEHVRFSVADTGIGIPPEQQQLIFQEFRQVENEHQDRYPGTGLGLTISRRLMELMGGSLSVESRAGSGSTFSGDIPIVPETLRQKEQGGES